MNNEIYQEAVRAMIDAGKWLMDMRMTWGSAGNMSVRIDETHAVVTASGTRFDQLIEQDFALCSIPDGTFTGRKPSKELQCHLGIYRQAPWAKAAIHVSPFYTTLAASSELEIPNNLFVENMYYLQRLVRIGYAHPGSVALSDMIEQAAKDANVILMKNHGVILYDKSLTEARAALEVLENTCHMALEARQCGLPLHPVSEEERRSFLIESGYRPPRPWQA